MHASSRSTRAATRSGSTTALDAPAVPWSRVRCGLDVSPRLAHDVVRAVRARAAGLLHTHMVHARRLRVARGATRLRLPFVSSRHNDDRYLLGPFRYVDRVLMRGVARLIAISDAVRQFLVRAGLPRVARHDDPLRPRRACPRRRRS